MNSPRERLGRLSIGAALIAMSLGAGIGIAHGVRDDASGPISAREATAKLGPSLGVFRREQTESERLEGANAANQPVPDRFPDENLALRRRVDVPGAPSPVFVWPGGSPAQDADGVQVCLAFEGVAGCPPLDVVSTQGVSLLTYVGVASGPGKVRVGGIARDGIMAVVIERKGKSAVSVPVRENVFLIDVAGEPVAVRWSDNQGDHRLPVEY